MTHKTSLTNIETLLEIMQSLRSPDGCPWDKVQTPESLTPYIMEEACELIDAIEEGSTELILDELGDLLLQVVFQAQIFKERDQFDFHDVANGIASKLVRRHPHVFNRDGTEKSNAELDRQWDKIKRSESTHKKTCISDHLPNKLPALQRAQKLISKTYQADRQEELPAGKNQNIELFEAGSNIEFNENLLGEALFALVQLAHNADLDAETALRKTTLRIVKHLDQK